MNRSRLIVGLLLITVAVVLFLLDYSTSGAIAIGVLGLVSLALARRK